MSNPEYDIIQSLDGGREYVLHSLVEKTGHSADAIRRALVGLEEKGFVKVTREKIINWILTKAGEETVSKGTLPEQRLTNRLHDHALPMKVLQSQFDGSPQEFSAAFGLAKRSNWIVVKNDNGETIVELTGIGKTSADHSIVFSMLAAVGRGEQPDPSSSLVADLSARGLITQKTSTNEIATITSDGVAERERLKKSPSASVEKTIGVITPSLLASGEWQKASFKSYDVKAGVEAKYPGRIHPLRQTIRDIRRVMTEMGFAEEESSLVESSFWNMDVMFIPQDHPAREIQDTFYLPGKATLPDADLVKRVKATHEHGGKTGSKGFGYTWDPQIASQLLLRTHITATTFRTLSKKLPIPSKTFSIGRIYRNEAIDATHLAEFHQVDGLIMGEGLTLRHLMGIVKEFYAKFGFTKIRFKPTYNPYTEPSMESAAYHPKLERWVEIVNSGMFRPETLKPLGIDVPVISWSFGIERLAMFLHEKELIKDIAGPDVSLDFIRNYPGVTHSIPQSKTGGADHGKR